MAVISLVNVQLLPGEDSAKHVIQFTVANGECESLDSGTVVVNLVRGESLTFIQDFANNIYLGFP